jgi:hypothetical protein
VDVIPWQGSKYPAVEIAAVGHRLMWIAVEDAVDLFHPYSIPPLWYLNEIPTLSWNLRNRQLQSGWQSFH